MDDDVILANYAITLMYYGYTLGLIYAKILKNFIRMVLILKKQLLKNKVSFDFIFSGFDRYGCKRDILFNFIESNSYVDIYQSNITTPIGYDFLSYLFYCSFFPYMCVSYTVQNK